MFVDFVQQLGVQLTPGQRVLSLVSFDGVDPCQLNGSDRDMARTLFGEVDTFPPEARGVVAWLKGARMGGSYLCALRQLYLGLSCALDTAPGELAFNVDVAPDRKTAAQPYRFITGAVQKRPDLMRLVDGEIGKDSFILRRPDGHHVQFEILAASAGGSSLRGRSYISCLLDESSFFRDAATGVVNDLELYRAVAPRIVTGGQLMVISTAWARRGLLWNLVEKNRG